MIDTGKTANSTGLTVIERYYRMHSRIYDATRWSFLFGRRAILCQIGRIAQPKNILEIGCGTGANLANLCRMFPDAQITGLDISQDMLARAKENTRGFHGRLRLVRRSYDAPLADFIPHDLVLFSYALSMFNPGWERAIECAHADLAQGGHVAVVDFHDSRFPTFKRWMGVNHVRMDGHLRPVLSSLFHPVTETLYSAYGGVWEYGQFIGRKK